MEQITVSRQIDAPPDAVRDLIADQETFMEAAGFDEVSVDGSEIRIQNRVGMLSIDLELRRLEDADAVFAYEQVSGIFETMRTRYDVSAVDGKSEVTATTEFALDVDYVGSLLDGTILDRQRHKELTAQFDYLEERLAGDS